MHRAYKLLEDGQTDTPIRIYPVTVASNLHPASSKTARILWVCTPQGAPDRSNLLPRIRQHNVAGLHHQSACTCEPFDPTRLYSERL